MLTSGVGYRVPPSKAPQERGGLTRRCSGLASLAAELHIVRLVMLFRLTDTLGFLCARRGKPRTLGAVPLILKEDRPTCRLFSVRSAKRRASGMEGHSRWHPDLHRGRVRPDAF